MSAFDAKFTVFEVQRGKLNPSFLGYRCTQITFFELEVSTCYFKCSEGSRLLLPMASARYQLPMFTQCLGHRLSLIAMVMG
jgi:hypothetical protein